MSIQMFAKKPQTKNQEKITLIGAGLAGCALGMYLAKRGFKVDIYERRPDIRKVDFRGGRSINLTLSARGIHVLKQLNLYKKVMKIAIPLKGRTIHSINGNLTFQPYGTKSEEVLYSIDRNKFNYLLLDEIEKQENLQIHFNQKCMDMDFDRQELKLRHEITGKETIVKGTPVIGTDGSASSLRMAMLRVRGFNFSQSYLDHGYKELTIAAGQNNQFLMDKNSLHIWPRGQYMLNGFPNLDGTFTCILFAPFHGEYSFESLDRKEKVVDFFKTQFPDVLPLMPNLVEKYFEKNAGSLITIKCNPWYIEDKALILGDAAHAIVPFYGQGMNCALEDCAYLDECVEKYGNNWKKVFQEFEKLRKVNTDAIADMSVENYIELRDRVSDPKFLLKKKVELVLGEKYPRIFTPKYSMIAFGRIPYSEAQAIARVQDRILEELCHNLESIEQLNWEKAEFLVKERLLNSNELQPSILRPAIA